MTSKNSFLYPLNDWVDVNAFFTVGKSMMNNVIPYKDIFEQKGILLYLIYGIGYLISHKTFFGVFLLEVLFFSIFLYYVYKTINLFLDKKYTYIILPILAAMICTSKSFVHGGSAEEFCFPFFAFTLYHYLRHFKQQEITKKLLFANGIMAGCILLIKYTLLGFWFSFMMFLFFDMIRKRKFKESVIACISFLLGMITPVIIASIYFLCTHSLKDFIDCYFIINMTAYNPTEISFLNKIIALYKGAITSLYGDKITFVSLCLIPISLYKLPLSKYCKLSLIGNILITTMGLFWGLHFYNYYALPLLIFLILSFIGISMLLQKGIDKIIYNKYNTIFLISILLLSLFACYRGANYRTMLFMKKEDMFQYKYAKYISQYENPTLINIGYLDCGLYTTTGIIPNTRFFEYQNIPYSKFPENKDSMKKAITNQEVMFIIYFTRKDLTSITKSDSYIFEHYKLVMQETQDFENKQFYAFLFKKEE